MYLNNFLILDFSYPKKGYNNCVQLQNKDTSDWNERVEKLKVDWEIFSIATSKCSYAHCTCLC